MPKLPRVRVNVMDRARFKYPVKPGQTVTNMPKDKGFYLGSCNRSACLRPGANWYNHGSLKYYCVNCAMELNYDSFNRKDSMERWGHLLCTEGEYDREKFQRMHDLHDNAKIQCSEEKSSSR